NLFQFLILDILIIQCIVFKCCGYSSNCFMYFHQFMPAKLHLWWRVCSQSGLWLLILIHVNQSLSSYSQQLFCASFSKLYKQLRSEEHTSELQSRFDIVCRLLLEKI